MTNRLIVDEDYNWVDTTTGMLVEVEDAFDLVNELANENEQLKQELKRFKPIIFESNGKPVTLYEKGDVE